MRVAPAFKFETGSPTSEIDLPTHYDDAVTLVREAQLNLNSTFPKPSTPLYNSMFRIRNESASIQRRRTQLVCMDG